MRKRNMFTDGGPAAVTAVEPIAASLDGTERMRARTRDRYAADFYREGPGGRWLSSLGVGTYLGECDDAEDERYTSTVARALAAGVNVVDTAINYRSQRSERAVGSALQRVIARGEAEREAILLCTKGGFIPLDGAPPASRDAYHAYLKRAFFDAGVMMPDDIVAGGHSLAPSFLRWSMAQSRQNLGVRTIDLYYLHNPEQQAAALPPDSLRERLRAAFMVMEEAVSRRDIAGYGCATWSGLRVPPGVKGHLAVRDLVALAREVAGDAHHFRAVQLPLNLAMPEATRVPTQPAGSGDALVPAIEAAVEHGLSVFVSASLMQAQLAQGLPDAVRALFPRQRTDAQRALAFVRSVPGVTTALVGMRHEAHLAENLESAVA